MDDIDLLRQESQLLWLFGTLTAQTPNKALVESLYQGLADGNKDTESPLESAFRDAVTELKASEAALIEAQKDFVNLLACVKKHPEIPAPMQSVAQKGHEDITALHAHLAALFDRSGFRPPADHSQAPDHLSTLLFLMSVQRHHQADYLAQDNIDEAHMEDLFLYTAKNHVLPWAPSFLDKAISSCHSPFYRTVFSMIIEYLKQIPEDH